MLHLNDDFLYEYCLCNRNAEHEALATVTTFFIYEPRSCD